MKIAENSALLVIDAQNDFLDMLTPELKGQDAIDNIKKVIDHFRKEELPIVYFKELHRKEKVDFGRELDGDEDVHCVEGTKGADFADGIEPRDGEFYIGKRRYSGFFGTDLEVLLKGLGVKTLYLVGFLTDVCVHYTAVDAHQHDYHVKVFKDAARGSDWDAHDAALNAIEYLQSGSIIETSDLS